MSNPPSYAAVVDSELQDITPTQKANAQAKIATILAAPETRAAAIQEVDTLTTHAIKTDQAFEDIRVKLLNMEAVAVRDQWVGFVPLVGGWIQLQTRFRELLLRSRKSAIYLANSVDRYTNVILPFAMNPAYSIADRKQALDYFINTGNPENRRDLSGDSGFSYALAFQDLYRDVKLYSAKFLDIGDKQSKIWKDQARALDGQIAQIKRDLESIQGRIAQWAFALGAGVAVAATGGLLVALSPFCPILGIKVAIAGLIAAGIAKINLDQVQAERQRKEADLRAKEAQLADIKRKQEALEKVQLDMAEAVRKTEDIIDRLKKFGDIWNGIAADALQFLLTIEDTTADPNYLFAFNLARTQEALNPLKAVLRRYAQLFDSYGLSV